SSAIAKRCSSKTAHCSSSPETPRGCALTTPTSGSIRAPPTVCSGRTGCSRANSRFCDCRTVSSSCTAATPGGSGAATRQSPCSRRRTTSDMARALHTLGVAVGILGGLAVMLAATGWLYLLRPASLPGPRIGDALPLDELSKRASVSLLLLVAVWALAGALVGLIARLLGAERLTSALLLALAAGLWSYFAAGVSLLIVRQVPAHDAFHAAAT